MAKNDRDVVARRELTHALEALGDGFGHETWGPGPVIVRLSKRQFDYPGVGMAIEALEAAAMASHDLLHRTKRDDALVAIRRLAPVFLELIIEKDGAESVKRNVWSAREGATYYRPAPIIVPPHYDEGLPAMTAAEMGELMKANLAINTAPVVNLPLDNARWKELVEAARIELGVPLPQQKLVDDAKPIVARRECDNCGMTEASDRTLALRKDNVIRCDYCSKELEDALARGCECPGCRSVRAKRRTPLTGSIISSNSANG